MAQNRMFKLSLPLKFVLLSLIITLIGITSVSFFSFKSSDDILHNHAMSRLSDDLAREKLILTNKLDTMVEDIQFLMDNPGVKGLIRATQNGGYDAEENSTITRWQNSLEQTFSTVLQSRPAYAKIRLIGLDQHGKEMIRVKRLGDTIQITQPQDLQNKGHRPYFQKTIALKANGLFFSRITLNREHGKVEFPPHPMLRIATPIFDPSGVVFGIIIISADVEQLTTSLSQAPTHIHYFLANEDGDYLIHPDEKKRLAFEYNRSARIQDDFYDYKKWHNRHKSHDHPLYQVFSPLDGIGLTVDHINFNDWGVNNRYLTLGAVAQLSVLEEDSVFLRNRILGLVTLSSILLTMATIFVARRLTRPIRLLTRVADQVTAGNEKVYIPLMGNDEITALGQSFHTMLQRLAASREELAAMNTTLLQSKQLADDANKAKSVFLATMSHEIRTPLNVILGMLELLQEAPLQRQYREKIQLAFSSSKMLLSLINDVLDYSKIEAGQFNLDNIDFDLRQLLYEVAQTMSVLAYEKKIELTVYLPQEFISAVCGDPTRLRQVFVNLIGNAIKFTPEGGLVECHGGPVAQTDTMIEYLFEVRDTGIGIPAQQRTHIFEHFTQADKSTTRQYGGTGLGLAVCKHLVHLMHGDIGVDLNHNAASGSSFHFTISLDKQAHFLQNSLQSTTLRNVHTLIVGSDGVQLALLCNALQAWEIPCKNITDIKVAYDTMYHAVKQGTPYHLVIINQPPGKNHLQALDTLQTTHEGIRFILLADLLDQGLDQASALPGHAICLKKPLDTDQLYDAITQLFQGNATTYGVGSRTHPPRGDLQNKPTFQKTASILVVDDQEANLKVTVGMLASIGCTPEKCTTVINGREAVEKVRGNHYEMILMDCQMPVMDGYQATHAIREWEKQQNHKPTPIIGFTADVTRESRESGQNVGMNDFLSKPVTIAELRTLLERYLPTASISDPLEKTDEKTTNQPEPLPEVAAPPNVSAALISVGLSESDIADVAEMILLQLPELMETLQKNLSNDHADTALATSHVLKGSMANTLFPTLKSPTRRLHQAILKSDWKKAQEHLRTTLTAYAPIDEALRKCISET